jgi:hypothetical protein
MRILFDYEARVAYANVAFGTKCDNPFARFTAYWTAFNNCYVTIFDLDGENKTSVERKNGVVQRITNGSVQIPKTLGVPRERDQLEHVFTHFDQALRTSLVGCPNTEYFSNRTPELGGHGPIQQDASGQVLNGVLSITRTVEADNPVWSPIDKPAYARFKAGSASEADVNLLSRQILFLLYSVRNNLLHGGKRFDDATDQKVVENALPLLEMILRSIVPAAWH